MEKIDPTKVGFFDLPREIRDIIYYAALPTSKGLSVHDDCPSFDPGRELEAVEVSRISTIELNGTRVSSNLIFVCKIVNVEVIGTFFQSNTFGFIGENHLTHFLGKLRSDKVTQFLKYRVASAIGSLGYVSHWITRLHLQVHYLSTASMFWLCRYGVPELQETFPRLVEVLVGFKTLINVTALRMHNLVEYMDGRVSSVPTISGLPSKEEVATIFNGIVNSLWDQRDDGQPNPPKYPDILRLRTHEFKKQDDMGKLDLGLQANQSSSMQEVTLCHWKRIFEAMKGNAPKRKQPMYGNDGHWEIRVWRALENIIKPSWKVREEDMGDEVAWAFARPAMRD